MNSLRRWFSGQSSCTTVDFAKYSPSDIIERDVCIIGGGAAGTYAAMQLQERHNKSVIVVEKEPRLGGQTMTYLDPESVSPVEYGVTWFMDLPVVRNYFSLLGIDVIPSSFTYRLQGCDFRTGEEFPAFSPEDQKAALAIYQAKLEEYPYLKLGFYLPHPVPKDLLLPFEDFVKKYNMTSVLHSMGGLNFLGDWLRQPTLYVMKYLNMGFLTGWQDGFLKPADRNNSSIYAAALHHLGGANVLLNSHVLHVDRDSDPDRVFVEVQSGSKVCLIRAKRIIVAVPPLLTTLHGFDLSQREKSLFRQFRYTYCYTGVVRIKKDLPPDVCYTNRASADIFAYPRRPCVLTIRPSDVPRLYTLHIGSDVPLMESEVRREILSSLRSFQMTTPEILITGSHSPYQLTVSTDAIERGFYDDLNGLQGHRRTYYIGAAFESHNSPQIWELTDQILQNELLPSLLKEPLKSGGKNHCWRWA
ncbi:uncharacterized protein KD926_005036 [Aspergillus affinis]|uniref:uncharacterized protein n=1 Tax=Aspergillus affinis TaxID=1070780 RepID=UPI0022FE5417|nr:uncharacterized protein KD926_005036 [Aspergillus affinis]KAI9034904.1 hypothetical protein KD926_005036 [Aspergillus affinis]